MSFPLSTANICEDCPAAWCARIRRRFSVGFVEKCILTHFNISNWDPSSYTKWFKIRRRHIRRSTNLEWYSMTYERGLRGWQQISSWYTVAIATVHSLYTLCILVNVNVNVFEFVIAFLVIVYLYVFPLVSIGISRSLYVLVSVCYCVCISPFHSHAQSLEAKILAGHIANKRLAATKTTKVWYS